MSETAKDDLAYRRALRRTAKDPIVPMHGPYYPGRPADDAVTFGALSVITPQNNMKSGENRSALFDAAQKYVDARDRFHADPDIRAVFLHLESGNAGWQNAWKTTVRISPALVSQFTPLCGGHLLIDWNPQHALMPSRGKGMSAMLGLAHEMFHAYHYATDSAGFVHRHGTPAGYMNTREEALTLARETITAFRCNDGRREHYYDSALMHIDDPAISVEPADAPRAAAAARLHAITKLDLLTFPAASRTRIAAKLEREAARLCAEQQPIALRRLRRTLQSAR